ncbi:hypothetical protein PR003_g4638 [Phytophthora rubi]|uniref:Uncharacterized protein n=1 Tax=Phytophthora rubi TaxID=129364 RepID=A0A6A3NV17_9STRA|nr:hypothetical protein PR001_g5408 [Phytophthora rubi]KAE9351938.1 hypothetical protein PR003_g4638 [Phytophthora rubi]
MLAHRLTKLTRSVAAPVSCAISSCSVSPPCPGPRGWASASARAFNHSSAH